MPAPPRRRWHCFALICSATIIGIFEGLLVPAVLLPADPKGQFARSLLGGLLGLAFALTIIAIRDEKEGRGIQ